MTLVAGEDCLYGNLQGNFPMTAPAVNREILGEKVPVDFCKVTNREKLAFHRVVTGSQDVTAKRDQILP